MCVKGMQRIRLLTHTHSHAPNEGVSAGKNVAAMHLQACTDMTGISPTGALTVASHPKFGSRAAFDCHGVDPLVCKEFRNGGLHATSAR